ncbi:Kae1-like domain-containing protein [Shewanella colwelliana]|uniref:Kae1-like domain-containing protein n=1 Tax=Shewanella colwelliana TaxID=23 RepID=UPI003736E896
MKIIKFEFTCSRQVPLYAHLCNQYLNYAELNINIGYQQGCYFIEAEGKQSQLEILADAIAQDFLISVWLTDSRIALVDTPQGEKKILEDGAIEQEFCQQCAPIIGDNQSADFGQLSLPCSCCHGEQRINTDYRGLTVNDIRAMTDTLLTHGQLTLGDDNPIHLSLAAPATTHRPRLLVCNPNTLNAQFHLNDRQILALSSIEKPLITVRPIQEHPKLDAPLYDLCFAYNRLLLIIAEQLRQKGIDWLFIDDATQQSALAFIDSGWVEVESQHRSAVNIAAKVDALHDNVLINDAADGFYYASHKPGRYHAEYYNTNHTHVDDTHCITLSDEERAICALNSVCLEHDLSKNCAIIFLSEHYAGQILTLDAKKNSELFFALPSLPDTGYEIYHQLEQSPQRQVLEKFKQRYPEDYLRLLDLKLPQPTTNLQSLWAIAAVLLGLKSRTMAVNDLADALIACALGHRGANSPRIDYPLTRGEAHRSLNWCKTLGTLMSFRLADDRDSHKLAFGMHDSLADYFANWIEHLDLNISVKQVALAGSEWQNPLLCQRVALRVGKNFPIRFNQQLDIDGNNYAIGALTLKKRRK